MFNNEPEVEREKVNGAQWMLIALIASVAGASLLYRMLVRHRLEQSSALFIGLPALLAILLTFAPKQKSITGTIVKGITFLLLLSGPVLGEGFVCILFASPIFYLVGIVIGLCADWFEKDKVAKLGCLALFTLPMCFEGVAPQLSFDRMQTVEVTRLVAAPAADVEASLSCAPRVATPLPGFLRIGFPVPLAARGCGLQIGATRIIRFSGAEGHPAGDLMMQATESRPGFASFTTVSDTTKLNHWMEWDRSEVEWRAMDAAHTQVTWRIVFERRLDPAWYFTPLERAAVHEAARYMIEANATPRSAK